MRSAFALRIISGISFLLEIQKSLRTFLNLLFTKWGRNDQLHLQFRPPFNRCSSPRENGIAERPQALRYPENKNNISLAYAQSAAERISNRSYCTKNRAARRLPDFLISC